MAQVIFEEVHKTKKDTPLMAILSDAPFKIKISCGKGKCRKCRCIATGDVNPPTENEKKAFTEEELSNGFRLACEVIVQGEVHVQKIKKKK